MDKLEVYALAIAASDGFTRVKAPIEEVRAAIWINQTLSQQHLMKVHTIAKNLDPGIMPWHHIGSWECEASKIGVCAYNYATDPAHDDCIYCGYPEERK